MLLTRVYQRHVQGFNRPKPYFSMVNLAYIYLAIPRLYNGSNGQMQGTYSGAAPVSHGTIEY